MKRLAPILFFAIFTVTTAFSQRVYVENLHAIADSLATQFVQENEPGLSIGIVYRGQPVLSSHYGLMNLDYDMKTSGSTKYNLASVSKNITALGILILEAEGKLKLQDKIAGYLPNLPKEYSEITIDQLLHHTSGIPSTDNLKLFAGIPLNNPWTMTEEMDLLQKYSKLNFEPGTEYMYSNGGYTLLAAVIESATGQDFAGFFEQKVFQPLNLQAGAYDKPGKLIENRAKGYTKVGENFADALTEAESVPGASNFYFSMEDMLTWMKLFLQEDSHFKQQVTKMMQPSFVVSKEDTISYSFGLNIKDHKGLKTVYHSGGTPGFTSNMMLFPEQEIGITILTNNEKVNVTAMMYHLIDILLADYLREETPAERVAVSLGAENLKPWVGTYRMKDGMLLKVLLKNGNLFLGLPDEQQFQLHPESITHYFIKEFDARLIFAEPSGKKPTQFHLIQGTNKQTGDYVDPKELMKAPPTLQDLLGSYHQKELDETYRLIENEGELLLELPDTFEKYLNFNKVRLKPIAGDVFNTDRLGVVEFLRNENNKINGFKLNDVGRLRNISFIKIE